jgi:hypothetical protein
MYLICLQLEYTVFSNMMLCSLIEDTNVLERLPPPHHIPEHSTLHGYYCEKYFKYSISDNTESVIGIIALLQFYPNLLLHFPAVYIPNVTRFLSK